MKQIAISIAIGAVAYFAVTRERCIPFDDWSPAVERSEYAFEECIQPNIDCERRQKTEPGLKCKWNDCPLSSDYAKLAADAGYPGRDLVCENDCGLSIFNFCIYGGRQNYESARRALSGALEHLKEFE